MAAETAAPTRLRERTRGNRLARAIWAGLATAAVLLVIDGVWAGRSLVRNLGVARAELNVGIEAIVTGDPEGAAPHFLVAAAAADRASAAAAHPSLGIAALLPVAGPNIDAAASVAAASGETAAAGATMVRVARTLDWTDIGIPAANAAGALDVEALEEAAPQMDAVVGRLDGALTELEAAGGDGLIGPVATGYRDALEHLTRRADLATRLRDSIHLGPAMFGGDRARRYLLVVPSLGVPRSGGGAPATVGVLVADQGVMRLESLAGGLEGLAPAPAELASVSSSPDWPTAAEALLEAARSLGVPRLDGAISLDSIAVEDLVWMAGDVTVPHRRLALSDDTTATALEIDAFQELTDLDAAETHAGWTSEIVRSFLSRRSPALESFALAAARDAHARHLAIYVRRRSTQRLVTALGLDGAAPAPEPGVLPLLASWSSTEGSHVGALVDTRIRQEVRLKSDGSATVVVELSFDNEAGTGPRSVLLGNGGEGVPVGTFAADVTLYVPEEARHVAAETSRPTPITVRHELGFDSVTGSVSIRGGDSSTLTVTYSLKDATTTSGDERTFVLRLAPQPTLAGIAYSIAISVPEGVGIVSASHDLQIRGSSASFSGLRGGPEDLEIRYVD
jgi:hypothetical protein